MRAPIPHPDTPFNEKVTFGDSVHKQTQYQLYRQVEGAAEKSVFLTISIAFIFLSSQRRSPEHQRGKHDKFYRGRRDGRCRFALPTLHGRLSPHSGPSDRGAWHGDPAVQRAPHAAARAVRVLRWHATAARLELHQGAHGALSS